MANVWIPLAVFAAVCAAGGALSALWVSRQQASERDTDQPRSVVRHYWLLNPVLWPYALFVVGAAALAAFLFWYYGFSRVE
ncbi:MAG: hypothetical protein BLM47_02745 [Candidatus Reconcilbacillus cellulovorans]|uniref:Uncharacterized protein n=1 Tax=Candidatus Reconcilbacillus cellulovorans TaxID=1906605 RepID=A0A2A6E2M9_9BACL|nr:MAG: hypothetical protein BLM47_02745 [Candidatus Reconcilbacillus cellulovorans]